MLCSVQNATKIQPFANGANRDRRPSSKTFEKLLSMPCSAFPTHVHPIMRLTSGSSTPLSSANITSAFLFNAYRNNNTAPFNRILMDVLSVRYNSTTRGYIEGVNTL